MGEDIGNSVEQLCIMNVQPTNSYGFKHLLIYAIQKAVLKARRRQLGSRKVCLIKWPGQHINKIIRKNSNSNRIVTFYF